MTTLLLLCVTFLHPNDDAVERLRSSLSFHASFDGSVNADHARGDPRLYTSVTGKREDGRPGFRRDDAALQPAAGRFGGALRFTKPSKSVVYFQATDNVAYDPDGTSGTVSFWLRLDPAKDLEPGYCDPIQITDDTWNDSSLWVDFTKENPRDFRLGAFADLAAWNPTKRKWDDIPEAERPTVRVVKPPFASDRWTHVVFTYNALGAERGGTATLYIDGKRHGDVRSVPAPFTWDPSRARILIALSYVGGFDDLAVFDRALSADEVRTLHDLDGGVASLRARSKG